MRENISIDIAKILHLDFGETFEIEGYSGVKFYFNENGLFADTGKEVIIAKEPLVKIILGEAEIKRGPFIPKQGDVYWSFYRSTFSDKWLVTSITWTNTVTDIAKFKVGWCYRTEAEAKSALPEIAKEQGVGYEL